MLHITNGDSAADGIRAAGILGDVLPCRDVLHDGPVPANLSLDQLRAVRARFIADCGWTSYDDALRDFTERDLAIEHARDHDEIVLWFEHDLYDQLQLLQLLDWFATHHVDATRLTLICAAEYLGPSAPARLRERFPARHPVSAAQCDLARHAWRAFRSPDPTAIETLLDADTSALPFVSAALIRHLEQFPSTVNGLSRTEAQALESLRDGAHTLAGTYVASHQQREDPVFLGDASFAVYMAALSGAHEPLLVTTNGSPLPMTGGLTHWNTELRLTEAGRAVIAGTADHITLNGIDRWLGGVHLHGDEAAWRWDPAKRKLCTP